MLPPAGVGKHLRQRIWHDTSAAGVVDFYPVPHRDRTEPPLARERSDAAGAVRRDRARGGLIQLTREARQPGWWHSFRDVLPNPYEVYIGLVAVRDFESPTGRNW